MTTLPLAPLLARVLALGYPAASLAARLQVSQKTLRGWADGSRTPQDRMERQVRDVLDCLEYPAPPARSDLPGEMRWQA